MTQWEQIKKEYSEIPVPVNGQAQMITAMEKARQKRSNRRKYVQYGSLVAAAMLVFLLLPDNFMRMGSKSAAPETAFQKNDSVMYDVVTEESAVEEGLWFSTTDTATGSAEMPEMNMSKEDEFTEMPAEEFMEDFNNSETEAAPVEKVLFTEEELEAIRLEIAKQLQVESVLIDNSIEYYINEQGLFVIVFDAGEIAPEENGVMEFVIPAEVVSP